MRSTFTKSTPNRSTSHRVNSHTLNQLPTKSTIISGIFKFQTSLVVRHRYFLSLLNKVQGCSNTQLSVYEFQVYLTNTGCQVWLSLFEHMVKVRPCSTKATCTQRSMMERSVHILEMQEVQEPMPSKSDYL